MASQVNRDDTIGKYKILYPNWRFKLGGVILDSIKSVSISHNIMSGTSTFNATSKGWIDFSKFIPNEDVIIESGYNGKYVEIFRGKLQDPELTSEKNEGETSLSGEDESMKGKKPWILQVTKTWENTNAINVIGEMAGLIGLKVASGFYDYNLTKYSVTNEDPWEIIVDLAKNVNAFPHVLKGTIHFLERQPDNLSSFNFYYKDEDSVIVSKIKYNPSPFFNCVKVFGRWIDVDNTPIGTTFLNNPWEEHLVKHFEGTETAPNPEYVDEIPADFELKEQVYGPEVDGDSLRIEGGSLKVDPDTGAETYEGAKIVKFEPWAAVDNLTVSSPWDYEDNPQANAAFKADYTGWRARVQVLAYEDLTPIPSADVKLEYKFEGKTFSELKWYFFRVGGSNTVVQAWGYWASAPNGFEDVSADYEQPDSPPESFTGTTNAKGKVVINNIPLSVYEATATATGMEAPGDESDKATIDVILEFVTHKNTDKYKKYIVNDTYYKIDVYGKYKQIEGTSEGEGTGEDPNKIAVDVKKASAIQMMEGREIWGPSIESEFITSLEMANKIGMDAINWAVANYYGAEIKVRHNPYLTLAENIKVKSNKQNVDKVFFVESININLDSNPTSMTDNIRGLYCIGDGGFITGSGGFSPKGV